MGNSLQVRQSGRTCSRTLVQSPSITEGMLSKAVGNMKALARGAGSLSRVHLRLQARFLGMDLGTTPWVQQAGLRICWTARQNWVHEVGALHSTAGFRGDVLGIRRVFLCSGQQSAVKGWRGELLPRQVQQEQVDPVYRDIQQA